MASETDLQQIDGVGPKYATDLKDAGYETFGALRQASQSELAEIVPQNIAVSVKGRVGEGIDKTNMTHREAKKLAKQMSDETKIRTEKTDGRQNARIMRREIDDSRAGLDVTVWGTVPADELPDPE